VARVLGFMQRGVGLAIGLALIAVGSVGLAAAYLPDAGVTVALQSFVESLAPRLGLDWRNVVSALQGPALRYSLAPIGLVLLFASLRRGAKLPDIGKELDAPEASAPLAIEKRAAKKAEKQAAGLARKGLHAEAAELLFLNGSLDKAADAFVKAGELIRAAEIRHDQNRFIESAELYLQAERFESAGTIFSQQEEFGRAAEAYLAAGSESVAAEMYEKAGDFGKAASCYEQAGFMRHAASAHVKSKQWSKAASCLEQVFTEDSTRTGAGSDPKKDAELRKLVIQTAKLHRRAGNLESSLSILERGSCFLEAAEVALELDQHAHAAELFRDAGDPERAAEALRAMGESEEAARILGEHFRDQGELKQAAEHFEEAGEFVGAGDLYRRLEEYDRAGECYAKYHDYPAAAEMYRMGEDRLKAAQAYEKAENFSEAAECYALAGLPEKEGECLAKAGQSLRAGQVYHRQGYDDEAIKVLQQLEQGQEGFSEASALLGDIFRSRGQLSLAVKKLKQAIGSQELARENLAVFYSLATVHEQNGELGAAVDIYEKILTFDYHYEDVEERLIATKDALGRVPTTETGSHETGTQPAGTTVRSQPGRYQIVGELGRGGMGIVFKAKDTVLDRLVAYKVLPDTLKENPQAFKNFLREAKAAAKLNHPGIVTVYDAGEQDGRYYIAMEYVDGTTLKEIVRRRGPISPQGILHVLVQVCEALAYAHEQKVVHRDIKTANTMWTRDRKAKLMDFGLAKVMEEVRNHTTVVSGTPYYMSPEQTLGKNVDHRTDIYSLGATLFEMATGSVPFKEGNIPYHHVHTPPPDVRELRPELPPELAELVGRCLRKDPSQRYQTAHEIIADVRKNFTSKG